MSVSVSQRQSVDSFWPSILPSFLPSFTNEATTEGGRPSIVVLCCTTRNDPQSYRLYYDLCGMVWMQSANSEQWTMNSAFGSINRYVNSFCEIRMGAKAKKRLRFKIHTSFAVNSEQWTVHSVSLSSSLNNYDLDYNTRCTLPFLWNVYASQGDVKFQFQRSIFKRQTSFSSTMNNVQYGVILITLSASGKGTVIDDWFRAVLHRSFVL